MSDRLKILQVGSSMPDDWGGIERYLSYLSPGLVARGHDVLTTVVSGSPLEERIGAPSVPLRVRQKYDLLGLAGYLRLFRQHRFDVVSTHFSPDYLIPAWAAKLAGQGGRIMTRHVSVPFKAGRVKTYLKLYEGFVGVSEVTGRVMAESGIPRELIRSVLGGCPALKPSVSREEARRELGVEGFAVGIFGRMVQEKGHLLGIEAAMQFCEAPVEVHLFGRGPFRADIKQTCREIWGVDWVEGDERLGGGRGVVDHGYVEDVANAMLAMDVVLVPSRWEEAFGFVAVEAMSLGVPVVAFGVGGLKEIISDDVDGFLVKPKDVQGMGAVLSWLAQDRSLGKRFGDAGQRTQAESFTVEGLAERTEAAYLSLIRSS